MTDYPYEGQLIADPVTFQRAVSAQVTVYDAADTGNTTPLALKDTNGLPTTNPLTSSSDAFVRPIYAPSQDIKYVGAGLTVFVSSAKGMRDAAEGAAIAAQAAANSAVEAVADRIATAAVNGSGRLILTKASGATVDAGPVIGSQGVPGPPGQDGSNVLPTEEAIAAAVNGNGPAKAALTVTILDQSNRRNLMVQRAKQGAGQWFLKKEVAGDFHFIRDLGEGYYLDQRFKPISGLPGGQLVSQMEATNVGTPMLSVDDTAAVHTGAWTLGYTSAILGYKPKVLAGSMTSGSNVLTLTSGTFAYGGAAKGDNGRRVTVVGAGAAGADLVASLNVTSATTATLASAGTTVTGAVVTVWPTWYWSVDPAMSQAWTSPGTATSLGIRVVKFPNGGLMKVAVNGSSTAANLAPTAQEVVTSGAYANTILIANGGTLAPTDRVIDTYTGGNEYDVPLGIASGLAPGAHILTITPTGYTHIGGTGARAYVSGFTYGTGAETPLTPEMTIVTTDALMKTFSAFDYALQFRPTGYADDEFSGSVHGYEEQTSLSVYIDGVVATLADGETKAIPGSASIVRTTKLFHKNSPTTVHATVTSSYYLERTGLRIRSIVRWATTAAVSNGYLAMFPQSGNVFDRCQFDLTGTAYVVNKADNSRVGVLEGKACAMWQNVGPYAAVIEIPAADVASGKWGHGNKLSLQDRTSFGVDRFNKVYLSRTGNVTPGTVWTGEFTLNWARLPEGAAQYFPV